MNIDQGYLDDFMNNDFINIDDLDKFNIPSTGNDEFLNQSDFNNELYQIISNNSSISTPSSSTSSSFSASSSNTNNNNNNNNQLKQEFLENDFSKDLEESILDMNTLLKDSITLSYLDYSTNSSPLADSVAESPEIIDLKQQSSNILTSTVSRPQTPFTSTITTQPPTPSIVASLKRRNSSISSAHSSSSSTSSSHCKKNLDSRLSLQRLGDLLETSSLDETMKIEKFILDIFQNELGFPLGYKTWIRDTNEEYRRYLVDELYVRVIKTYPQLTKNLLETVIKRATYSMMQGRLRKERRAAHKAKRRS